MGCFLVHNNGTLPLIEQSLHRLLVVTAPMLKAGDYLKGPRRRWRQGVPRDELAEWNPGVRPERDQAFPKGFRVPGRKITVTGTQTRTT